MSDAVVRVATAGDAGAIARVHVSSWRAAYAGIVPDRVLARLDEARRAEQWRGWVDRGAEGVWVLVAEERGDVVGFVAFHSRGDRAGEVQAVYLDPGWWRRGVGRMLMEAAEARLVADGVDEATLWVLTANGRARAFYERVGWQPDGATQDLDFDGTPVPEVRYRRSLEPAAAAPGA